MGEVLGPYVTGSLLSGRCFVSYDFVRVAVNRVSSYVPGKRLGVVSLTKSQRVWLF